MADPKVLRCACCPRSIPSNNPLAQYWFKFGIAEERPAEAWLCSDCYSEARNNPAPKGALAPTEYRRGMEDGDDHCMVCGAIYDGDAVGGDDSDGWHTHEQCFEEGKSLGALDENIECARKLAERLGCDVDYFHKVLERVPPAKRLPGELRPAAVLGAQLALVESGKPRATEFRGLYLTLFVPMPSDTARFTHEHMMRVKLRRVTAQVSIDDDGHTCQSDYGLTCGLCQRDMTPGSQYAAEQAGNG